MPKLVCYGSNVLIEPIEVTKGTSKARAPTGSIRGIIRALGTTSTIHLEIDDVVHYNPDDILSSVIIGGVSLDIILHYKIYVKEDGAEILEFPFNGFGKMQF
jgi:hypothetical protein